MFVVADSDYASHSVFQYIHAIAPYQISQPRLRGSIHRASPNRKLKKTFHGWQLVILHFTKIFHQQKLHFFPTYIRNTKFQALEVTLVVPPPPPSSTRVSHVVFKWLRTTNSCLRCPPKSTQSFVKLGQMLLRSSKGGEWKKALTHARTNMVTLKNYFLPSKDIRVHA